MNNLVFNKNNLIISFENSEFYINVKFNNIEIASINKDYLTLDSNYKKIKGISIYPLLKEYINMSEEDVDNILKNKITTFKVEKPVFSWCKSSKKDIKNILRVSLKVNGKYIHLLYLRQLYHFGLIGFSILTLKCTEVHNSVDETFSELEKRFNLSFSDIQKEKISAIIIANKFSQ